MDIYSFIPSCDIATHCQKIGHQFTPAEMAAIIYRSDKPMKEKHQAYQKIIDELPDMPMPIEIQTVEERREYFRELSLIPPIIEGEHSEVYEVSQKAAESLHIYLKEWMEWEKQAEKDFVTKLPEPQYGSSIHLTTAYALGSYARSTEEIYETIHSWITQTDNVVNIKKLTDDYNLNHDAKMEMKAEYTIDGKMIRVTYCDKVEPTDPGSIPINVPMPFQKGDTVKIMGSERTYRRGRAYVYNLPDSVNTDDISFHGNLYYTDEKGETHKDSCHHSEILKLCYARK